MLRREFLFQLDGRRTHARGVYPGASWFALLCAIWILWEYNSSRHNPGLSSSAPDHFQFLVCCQVVLIALRSTVYTALSFARDLQSHTATVVRVTPLSRTSSLLAKLCACLAPLWCELLLFLPAALLFFSVYVTIPAQTVLAVFPFLFVTSLVGGCLGLLLGSMSTQANQAARNARMMVLYLLFFFPVLYGMSEGYFLPVGTLGVWFLLAGRKAPHRRVVWGVLLALAGVLGLVQASEILSLAQLYPMMPVHNLDSSAPWAAGLVYLGLAAVCFLLARQRYNYAR